MKQSYDSAAHADDARAWVSRLATMGHVCKRTARNKIVARRKLPMPLPAHLVPPTVTNLHRRFKDGEVPKHLLRDARLTLRRYRLIPDASSSTDSSESPSPSDSSDNSDT